MFLVYELLCCDHFKWLEEKFPLNIFKNIVNYIKYLQKQGEVLGKTIRIIYCRIIHFLKN